MDLRETFQTPGAEWRGAPFWSWNDRLDEAELRRQVREMAAAGMGGFFMHSRVGLLTPFLGEAWMRAIAACIDEAERCGINAWLYDEDRWPSGFAGGTVPGDHPEHRVRRLCCTVLDEAASFRPPDGNSFALAGRLKNGTPTGPLMKLSALKGKGRVAVFHDAWGLPSPWFNDGYYTDLLDADAVRAFVEAAYDPYDRFARAFGTTVPGMFTDEPNHCPPARDLPWTPSAPERFRERTGADLLEALPQLFFRTGNYRKVRHDFYTLMAELFATSFTRQINAWCRARGLKLTGHFLCEDDLVSAVRCAANPMRHYEEMDLPGVDHLGANIALLLTMKQVSSVAQQLGRERVLCELYGTSGWHFTLEQQKWIGDWEYALGVNLRCQHLCLYTLRGCRKRDFPPSIFFQQPWWPEYRRVEDYFARLGFMLTRGGYVADVLVVHPQHSAYCEITPDDPNEAVKTLNTQVNAIAEWLCGKNVGWHFGDESVMSRHAHVEGARLHVGQASYETVIIPPALTLCSSTLELLRPFAQAGGRIIAVEPTPTLLDGEASRDVAQFITTRCERIPHDRAAFDAALPAAVGASPRVFAPSGKLYSHVRRDGAKTIVFVCNTDFEHAHDGTLVSPELARFERWDLETGEVEEVAAALRRATPLRNVAVSGDAGGETHASARFVLEPAGSLLFVIDAAQRPSGEGAALECAPSQPRLDLRGPWRTECLDPNVLVLDTCRYRVGGAWSDRMPVWKAQEELRAALGLRSLRANEGASLWKLELDGRDHVEPPRPLELLFEFESAGVLEACELLIETPEQFRIELNGAELAHVPDAEREWRIDPCMRRVPLGQALRAGRNELVLACEYTGRQELETIFLLGDFGVLEQGRRYVVASKPKALAPGDWTRQGYPFYVGTMAYETDFELPDVPAGLELAVEFDGATVCRVIVNGQPCATLWHRPWAAPVAAAARQGRNTLRLELVTTLHNMFGPHHYGGRIVAEWVDANKFSDEAHWDDRYALLPSGLRSASLCVAAGG